MAIVKKASSAVLVAAALAVAVWFIVNSFFDDPVLSRVWTVLDVLQCLALGLALVFNYHWKARAARPEPGAPVTRRYLEANAVFYATCALTIMFLHNWFSLIALGLDPDDHRAWIIWDLINTLLPIVIGVTGCRLWREANRGE